MPEKLETLADALANARTILAEESWIDEVTLLDEDGEPDDYAQRVVRRSDMAEAIDRIEAAAKRERALLDANVNRVRELEAMLDGAANTVLGCAIKQKQSSPGNAAALREALERIVNCVLSIIGSQHVEIIKFGLEEIKRISRAALSAPAQNAGIYKNWETALPAWAMETGEEVDSKTGFRDNAQLKRFLDWLFAEAEGGDHA